MSTETLTGANAANAPLADLLLCQAQFCKKVATTNRGFCDAHHRALALSSSVQDAVLWFLNTGNAANAIKPGTEKDEDIISAGEHIFFGITKLVGTLFEGDVDVLFDET